MRLYSYLTLCDPHVPAGVGKQSSLADSQVWPCAGQRPASFPEAQSIADPPEGSDQAGPEKPGAPLSPLSAPVCDRHTSALGSTPTLPDPPLGDGTAQAEETISSSLLPPATGVSPCCHFNRYQQSLSHVCLTPAPCWICQPWYLVPSSQPKQTSSPFLRGEN